jgi:hypothetical protein
MMVTYTGLLAGGGGFVMAHRFRGRIDAEAGIALARVRQLLTRPPPPDEDLTLAGRLISSIQGGASLDAALEAAFAEASGGPYRVRLRGILDGRPPPDFLSSFLHSALETGMPALASLQNLERALRSRRKLSLRAGALSAQCRAQAEVLSWLPWALGGAIALTDFDWFTSAAHHAISWVLWAAAVVLAGFGRQWIDISLRRALRPRGAEETLEEVALPDFTLRVIATVSQGKDVESALEHCLAMAANPELSRALASTSPGAKVLRLRGTLRHAARTGAPVREELGAFLQDLQSEIEARWEERVQRLPVALLAPLFVCFFPSSLLVLIALLLPLCQVSL